MTIDRKRNTDTSHDAIAVTLLAHEPYTTNCRNSYTEMTKTIILDPTNI